jgi:hypothetical protein
VQNDPDADNQPLIDAKDVLEKALSAYYEVAHPGAYVDSYVIATRYISSEADWAGRSVVGTLVGTDQDWLITRGIIEVVHESAHQTQYEG